MKLSLFSVALPFMLLGITITVTNVDAASLPGTATTTVSEKSTYSADSAEAKGIVDWIKRNSPAYSPILRVGEITVSRTYTSTDNLTPAASPNGPPVPLPAHGVEGEVISVTNSLPGGATETWTYQWTIGEWKLIQYHFDTKCQGASSVTGSSDRAIAAQGPCID